MDYSAQVCSFYFIFILFYFYFILFLFLFFFFFQAEDGIRDHCVTGVQTCALPISLGDKPIYLPANGAADAPFGTLLGRPIIFTETAQTVGDQGDIAFVDWKSYNSITKAGGRSEERRVGKECRSRWWRDH